MSYMSQTPIPGFPDRARNGASTAVSPPAVPSPAVPPPAVPLCPMARMNCLPITDRQVALGIRAWVEATRNKLPPAAAARAAFETVGMADAASLIHALMTAVTYGARRPLDVPRLCTGRLTDDENLLLDAIALGGAAGALNGAAGRVDAVMALRPMLTTAACRPVAALCAELAKTLAHSGSALDGRLERLSRRAPSLRGPALPPADAAYSSETDGDSTPKTAVPRPIVLQSGACETETATAGG